MKVNPAPIAVDHAMLNTLRRDEWIRAAWSKGPGKWVKAVFFAGMLGTLVAWLIPG